MRSFVCVALIAPTIAFAQIKGPSSSEAPYMLPVAPGVKTVSLLTTGNSVNNKPNGTPYRMVGMPDGLGAYSNGDGTISVTMNHEFGHGLGIVRAHGTTGGFVSEWRLNPTTRTVLFGQDLCTTVNPISGGAAPFGRFCAGEMAAPSAFFDATTGLGTTDRLHLTHEESGTESRAYGFVATGPSRGQAQFLPLMGRFSGENAVAHPNTGSTTVVCGTEDTTPGQIYIYYGTKQSTGSVFDKAGLTNGRLYGIKVAGFPSEDRTNGVPAGTPFSLVDMNVTTTMTGATLETASSSALITKFNRPEDSCWDTKRQNRLYVVTTDRQNTGTQVGRARIWAFDFVDVTNPALGGTVQMILDGTEGQQMIDNICVNKLGHLLVCEDPGSIVIPRIWYVKPDTHESFVLARHDAAKFGPGGSWTQNLECTGIYDASELMGPGWYLFNTQVHVTNPDTELAEYGQFQALYYQTRMPGFGR